MGDPKKQRKKYQTPIHPWRRERLEAEKQLEQTFGTKNKTEQYKMDSVLRGFKRQIKKLLSSTSSQSEKEKKQLFDRMIKLGLLPAGETNTDAILGLKTEDIMSRRLQTVIVKKELARTIKQARQMITHGHIAVNEKKITAPSYLVPLDEESKITFSLGSSFFSEEHPERQIKETKGKKRKGEEALKKKEVVVDKELEAPEGFETVTPAASEKELQIAVEEAEEAKAKTE